MININKYKADDIAKQVHDSIIYYQELYNSILEKENKTKSELRQEIKDEYEERNKYLENQLSLSVGFLHSEKELDDYINFKIEHEPCQLKSEINNGKIPYITQIETGIGTRTTVHCQICGESKDITDIDVW